MRLRLEPVKVWTGSADQDGHFVFDGEFLVAVIVRLSDDHESLAGKWFLEAGFGKLNNPIAPVFDDLQAAQDWILPQLRQQH